MGVSMVRFKQRYSTIPREFGFRPGGLAVQAGSNSDGRERFFGLSKELLFHHLRKNVSKESNHDIG